MDILSSFVPTSPNEKALALCKLAADAYAREAFAEMHHFAKQALEISPDHPDALQLLGLSYRGMGDNELAIQFTKKAVQRSPNSASVQENYGSVLVSANRLSEGIRHLEASIKLDGGFIPAYRALSKALMQYGKLEQALKVADKGLLRAPNDVALVGLRGMFLRGLGRETEAITELKRCIDLDPQNASAQLNLGNAYGIKGLINEALEYWNRALELKPGFPLVENNILAATYEAGFVDEALELLDKQIEKHPQDASLKKIRATISNYSIVRTREDHQKLTQIAADALMSKVDNLLDTESRPIDGRKVRIGFMSGDFRNNPVGYFVENALKYIDRKRFETYAISLFELPDEITQRLKRSANKWHPIPNLPPREVAKAINKLNLDILVDLFGFVGEFELFSICYKPAPIIASWIGYFATTKLPVIDYVIGDQFVTPETEQAFFSEKLMRLRGCYLCYSPSNKPIEPSPAPYEKNGFVTFGNYGAWAKLNEDLLKTWAKILVLVPNSKLLLKSKYSKWPRAVDRIVNVFEDAGVSKNRIIFDDQGNREEYLETFSKMDLWIDTFPFVAGTTACDALYMGVPVLTLQGDRFCGCIATSILNGIGHPELVAESKDEFIQKAVHLANHPEELIKYRKILREELQNSIVMDGAKHTKQLEVLFLQMIEDKQTQKQKENNNAGN